MNFSSERTKLTILVTSGDRKERLSIHHLAWSLRRSWRGHCEPVLFRLDKVSALNYACLSSALLYELLLCTDTHIGNYTAHIYVRTLRFRKT